MGKTLPMLPELTEFKEDALMYVLENSGAPDRDRKITIQKLRELFTTENNEFREVTLAPASPGAVTTVDVTGTKNVTLVVWGRFPNPTDNRIDITGTVPEGCVVTVLNVHLGLLDLRVQGSAPTTSPEELDFGLLGHAELVSRDGAFILTVMNDSRWNKLKLEQAVEVETTRAQTAEGALAGMIQGEATQRQDDITQTQALISAEVDRATAAEASIREHRSRLSPQTVTLWTNTGIYSQNEGAITVRGPATQSGGVPVNSTPVLVIEGADSELIPDDILCWRPATTFDGPTMGAGNTLATKWQVPLAGATGIAVTGGSPTQRVAMLSWSKSLGKVVLEKLPTSTVEDPAATVGLALPAADPDIFEELLVRVIIADDVSCELIVRHPTNNHGLEIPRATMNDGRNWWIRARHEVGGEWKIDCWWEPKRL